MSHLIPRALVLVLLACTAGCAYLSPIGPLPPPEDPEAAEAPYVIGAHDKLTISVWKNPELTVSVPVRSDGKISVPLLDDVEAAGRTPEELKADITASLAEFITAPDVTVVVLEMNSKVVSVIGAVAHTGPVLWNKDMRVLDAITRAGGFTTWARTYKVQVLRHSGESPEEYRFNYDAYLAGRSPGSNFLLRPGDEIVVPD